MDILEELGLPRLEIPASEDPMRMSPDMDQHLSIDGDIDIDLDLDAEPLGEYDDDAMDGQNGSITSDQYHSDHPMGVPNDDDMFNDDRVDGKVDDHNSVIDEDLDDAYNQLSADNILNSSPKGAQPHGQTSEPSRQDFKDAYQEYYTPDQFQRQSANMVGDTAQLPTEEQTHGIQDKSNQLLQEEPEQTDLQIPQAIPEDLPSEEQNKSGQQESVYFADDLDSLDEFEEGATGNSGSDNAVAEEQLASTAGKPAIQVSETTASRILGGDNIRPQDPQISDETRTSLSDLHPIILIYQDNEMSLFPSTRKDTEQPQTYFLEHQSVAGESISRLLQACRSVLANSIGEQDELELRIVELGLSINESAAESLETTLEQMLEIFLHLSHNDGIENPEPLYTELHIKTRCSHRLDYLLNAVAEDKGLSELEFPDSSGNVDEDTGSTFQHGETGDDQGIEDDRLHENRSAENAHGSGIVQLGTKNDLDGIPIDRTDPIATPAGPDRESSRPADDSAADAITDPEADVLIDSTAEEPLQDKIFETDIRDGWPHGVAQNGHTSEGVEQYNSVVEYPDDGYIREGSSVGSSTLRGDTIETKSTTFKASTPEPDYLEPNAIAHRVQATSNAACSQANQQPSRQTVDHVNGDPIIGPDDKLYFLDQDTAGSTEELSNVEDDFRSEEGLGESDILQDEDDYDEAEGQGQTESKQAIAEEHDNTLQEETSRNETPVEPSPDTLSRGPAVMPNHSTDSTSEQSTKDATLSLKATQDAGISTRPGDDVDGNSRKESDEPVLTDKEGQPDQFLPSSSRPTSPYTHADDDQIDYDEDEGGQSNWLPRLASSPRSLKRARNSLEGEAEANGSSIDMKRARPS